MDKEKEQPDGLQANDQHDFDEIVTPIAEQIAKTFKVHHVLFWGAIGIVFTTIHTLIMAKYEGVSIEVLWPSISFGILPFLMIISNIHFSKILEKFTPSLFVILSWGHKETLDWYSKEIKSIFSDKYMLLSGIIMCLSLLPVAYNSPLFPSNSIAEISFMVVIVAITITGGGMIYSLCRMIVMIGKLGETGSVRISIYQHPLTSIKAIGSLMTKVSLTLLMIYSFGISYSIFCKNNLLSTLCTVFVGILVMFIFILPQCKIHKIMATVKHERLIAFSRHLENSLRDVTLNPSEKNISQVRELFAIQRALNDMNEWPFDAKMLLTVLTGIAAPVVGIIVQVLWKP